VKLRAIEGPRPEVARGPVIASVEFDVDAVTVVYVVPDRDLKANGIVHSHSLRVPYGDQYDDELDAVREAAIALVKDVLEDVDAIPAMQLSAIGEEEDLGMGFDTPGG
jgi:hypothetical protein